jgi:aminoglycoside phosphotransferase (APT) family kinase protein
LTLALPPLADLLAAHGLAGVAEEQLAHDGYSGAALTRLTRPDGTSFVVKRMSLDRDWVMRSTDDGACREAHIASAELDLGPQIATPTLGAARDGGEYAILMRNISDDLLPPGMIAHDQLGRIIEAIAALHRTKIPGAAIPWCPLGRRMTLLTPAGGRIAQQYGAPVARDILEGWRLFDRHATPAAREVIHALFSDARPLLTALRKLPAAFLHGDLKLDNIGIAQNGCVWLIDWAMTLVAPPAGELGWFLAINSRRIPVSLAEAMEMYAAEARIPATLRPMHDGLTAVCGLLLRGWRKGLDAGEGLPDELRWWCERVEAARPVLG